MPLEIAQLQTPLPGKVSTANSSTALLGIGATFTGTAEDVTDYAIIYVTVFASHASATDGLSIEQSSDGANWDHTDVFTVLAATGKTFSFQAGAKFFRVRYTNGAVAQAAFRLQTVLKPTYGKPSSHRIQDPIVDEDDAELAKTILTGKKPDGTYTNVNVDASGNLFVLATVAQVNPSLLVQSKLINGGSSNLLVDGDPTPAVFQFLADPTDDIVLNELRFVFSAAAITFDGTKFGSNLTTLPNGILVELVVNNGQTSTIGNVKINEHFMEFASQVGINVLTEFSGTNDLLLATFNFGGAMRLVAGTADKVKVTIRDDLTPPSIGGKYLQATVYGQKLP